MLLKIISKKNSSSFSFVFLCSLSGHLQNDKYLNLNITNVILSQKYIVFLENSYKGEECQ